MTRWQGILCHIGKPSRMSPGGARGHRIIVSPSTAEQMVALAIGKPIWTEHRFHPEQRQIGVIEEAVIVDDTIVLAGLSYQPDELTIQASAEPHFGMSFDIDGAHVADIRADIWTIKEIAAFHGAAVRSRVAFESSFEWLEASHA